MSKKIAFNENFSKINIKFKKKELISLIEKKL